MFFFNVFTILIKLCCRLEKSQYFDRFVAIFGSFNPTIFGRFFLSMSVFGKFKTKQPLKKKFFLRLPLGNIIKGSRSIFQPFEPWRISICISFRTELVSDPDRD